MIFDYNYTGAVGPGFFISRLLALTGLFVRMQFDFLKSLRRQFVSCLSQR
jgi:hypothetical protein